MAADSKRAFRGRHRARSASDQVLAPLARAGGRVPLTAAALVVVATITGCGATGAATPHDASVAATAGSTPASSHSARSEARPVNGVDAPAPELPEQLPGLGPDTRARIPAQTRQVVLVTGQGKNSNRSQVVLYRRTSQGWQAGARWSAHNALEGWTDDHHLGDLRSPIGVFTLSDAGGRMPDPGSNLPYTQSTGFHVGGTGFDGEPLAGAFDYVIAIDYNHKKGTSPLDWTRPLGAYKGGGIWLHVDHGGPTHGCVSIAGQHIKELLRTLDPALHPVVVMGDAASLDR
ncbi:L,D-transpeptidase family protein (plasmid) [Streptomyces sp. FXJ1.172]|uniref:L,D-transpeptidase family protein n=1 Tax=Streptomyces sp. FXJ1.172 TaxID=710705 RepID=UPI0023DD0FB9|nr:L,D-transpeptidase family protein [Streptomyces sp. FXJ1.172]WEP00840.1 L,D-transpeptidase family protein [Streptomyces sp. FXJ1.172]